MGPGCRVSLFAVVSDDKRVQVQPVCLLLVIHDHRDVHDRNGRHRPRPIDARRERTAPRCGVVDTGRGQASHVHRRLQDRLLTVVFTPAGAKIAGFDPRSLPHDRVADLVEETRTTLNVDSLRSWQLIAESVTGPLRLRVVVTGDGGTGTLEADGRGEVLRRSGS